MGNFSTRTTIGAYQYFDGKNMSFGGAETRSVGKQGYIGLGGFVASEDFKNPYGLVDIKGKWNYDKKGIFDQNIRVRTAFDDDLKTTQIRYSPVTVNIPINDDISVYTNTHYSGKYNYQSKEWSHSIGNFTGISCDLGEKNNLALEVQRYNLQDLKTKKENEASNWSVNLMYTYKF